MKTKIFKGIGIIFVVGIVTLFAMVILQITDQAARSYSGFYEAQSLTEVYAYQQKINEAAVEVDAAILESNIMMTSPPRYTFEVVMPDYEPFAYGKVLPWGRAFWQAFGLAGIVICAIVMVLLILHIVKGFPKPYQVPKNKESK